MNGYINFIDLKDFPYKKIQTHFYKPTSNKNFRKTHEWSNAHTIFVISLQGLEVNELATPTTVNGTPITKKKIPTQNRLWYGYKYSSTYVHWYNFKVECFLEKVALNNSKV